MLFQDIQWTRFLVGLIPIPFAAIVFAILADKVFRWNRSRSSITLMVFYISIALGMIFNTTYLFITIFIQGILLYFAYYITAFVLIFPFIFILLFLVTLLKSTEEFSNLKYFSVILGYGVIMGISYIIPGGITLSETGSPLYSMLFMILIYVIFSGFITIPIGIYSMKIYKTFKDTALKKKLRLFVWGVGGLLLTVYGAVLFNTSSDVLYKSLWSIVAIVILIPSALFVYYGLGKSL